MNNPYIQVALTYIRRPFSSWNNGLMFGMIFYFMIVWAHRVERLEYNPNLASLSVEMAAQVRDAQQSSLEHEVTLMQKSLRRESLPFAILFLVLMTHVLMGLADSQARLIPDYRRIHITVAGAAALLCAVLLPIAFAWFVNWNPLGFVAITVLMFSVVFCTAMWSSFWLCLLALAMWLLLCTNPMLEWIREIVAGEHQGQAAIILATSVFLTLLGGRRLVRRNEDMSECPRLRWDSNTKCFEVTGTQAAKESRLLKYVYGSVDKKMASLTHHAQLASTSRWSRICRWQIGIPTSRPVVRGILPLALFFILLTLIMNKGGPLLSISLAVGISIMPALMVSGGLLGRKKFLPRESLMCVDRPTYLKQVGMAAVLSQLQLWLGMIAVFVFWWCCIARLPFSNRFAYLLAASALAQPGFFGVNAWFLRFRSHISIVLGWTLFIQVQVLIFALVIWVFSQRGVKPGMWPFAEPVAFFIMAFSAVLGLVLAWDAYRRWLVTDFD